MLSGGAWGKPSLMRLEWAPKNTLLKGVTSKPRVKQVGLFKPLKMAKRKASSLITPKVTTVLAVTTKRCIKVSRIIPLNQTKTLTKGGQTCFFWKTESFLSGVFSSSDSDPLVSTISFERAETKSLIRRELLTSRKLLVKSNSQLVTSFQKVFYAQRFFPHEVDFSYM